jgi:hypothetical protein
MNGIVLSIVALFCSTSFASTNRYFIKTQLLVDGKLVAQPQISALEDEAATMEIADNKDGNLKMQVVATGAGSEEVKDAILMKFNLEYTNANRLVKSSPQILIKEGSEATVRLADRQGNRDVQMKVVVKRE